jgi:hypothetical protein
MSAARPWEVTPALTEPRLVLLARLAVEARSSALADARRDEGDTNWGIGCRAYERFVHKLTKAAGCGEHPWLDLIRDGLSFTVVVEGVFVRAYTGRADKPEMKHVLAAQIELERADDRQLALPFFGGAPAPVPDDPSFVWLMAVETSDAGAPTRVVFFQANPEGLTRNAWDAPLEELAPKPAAATATDRERVPSRRRPVARRGAPPVARPLFAD